MNTMTFQSHTARVEYDERDDIFVGRVLGLRSIIGFHGKTVAELRREFAAAIGDYLADCEEPSAMACAHYAIACISRRSAIISG